MSFAEALEMHFPEPDEPLLEGPGPPIPWSVCMQQTAAQTNRYLDQFGHLPPPPCPEERFVLED